MATITVKVGLNLTFENAIVLKGIDGSEISFSTASFVIDKIVVNPQINRFECVCNLYKDRTAYENGYPQLDVDSSYRLFNADVTEILTYRGATTYDNTYDLLKTKLEANENIINVTYVTKDFDVP